MQAAQITVLMLENDLSQANMIREMLAGSPGRNFSVRHVKCLEDGLRVLKNEEFNCALVEGLEWALSVRKSAKQVPIVVLLSADDEEAALKSLQMDIQDYLVKGDLNGTMLARAIRCAVQRKRVSMDRRRSEESLLFATEAADLGMWHWDLVRDELTWNDRCRELFALENPVTYASFMKSIHEEDRERVDAAVRNALQQKTDYNVEMRVMLPDGRQRWVMSKGRGFYDQQGNAVDMHGIALDITERKEKEASLQLVKDEWERTFNAVPDLITIMDARHRIVRVNRAMADKLGRTPKECEGLPCHTIVHGTTAPPRFCPHRRTCADGKEHRSEIHEPRLGSDFLVSTTPLTAPDGEVLGVVHVARDISELKRAGEKIKQLNAELEKRAAELESANKELEAFNYSAAHDLRQPLTIISSYCQAVELLCGEGLDEQCKGYIRDAHRGVDRMNGLINSLLHFSRMSRVELHREPTSLSDTTRAVATELRMAHPQRTVDFLIADEVLANGDPDLLRIVLDNLIGNAWKYTGMKEDGTAVIEFGIAEAAGKAAYFVRDNGPGFDMADAGKLFVPFKRLAGAEVLRGFGIGLATVERIILRHGGKIWAEGEPGRGATFYFTLGKEQ